MVPAKKDLDLPPGDYPTTVVTSALEGHLRSSLTKHFKGTHIPFLLALHEGHWYNNTSHCTSGVVDLCALTWQHRVNVLIYKTQTDEPSTWCHVLHQTEQTLLLNFKSAYLCPLSKKIECIEGIFGWTADCHMGHPWGLGESSVHYHIFKTRVLSGRLYFFILVRI